MRDVAVAVEALADAVEARQPVPEFLVVLHARGRRGVLDLCVPGREEHFGQAFVELVGLAVERRLFAGQACQRGRRRHQSLGDAAELAGRERGSYLFDPRQGGRDGRVGRVHARQDVVREFARRREGGVERAEAAVDAAQRARQLGDGRFQARSLQRERAEEGVEVFDQFAQLLLVDVERGRHFADALHQFGEVVGLGAVDRLLDDSVPTQRLFSAPVGLVQGLRGVDAADFGVLFCVFGRVRLARQPVPPSDEEVL